VVREAWSLDWRAQNTPLGLPGQRQAVCTRTSFIATRAGLPEKRSEVHFYATSLPPAHASLSRLQAMIREHWGIENRLHHPKDRTWLEDRHWLGNRKTGAVVSMLRSESCSLLQSARFSGVAPEAHCPERIEYCNRYPQAALELVVHKSRL
jgi:hypothetical protein